MTTLTVTAKGQVTFRKDLLQHLGVHAGDRLTVEKLPDGRTQVVATKPIGQISDAFDVLKSKITTKRSINEMNAIAAEGWAGRP